MSTATDTKASSGPVMCEVCGTYFESRRGLSSHARLHLRQLGVTLSETSGAPISLLYRIVQERDGSLPDHLLTPPASTSTKKATAKEKRASSSSSSSSSKPAAKIATPPKPKAASQGSPVAAAPKGSPTASSPPPTAKANPPPPSSVSPFLLPSLPIKALEAKITVPRTATPSAKPLWAPQETDAPLTLAVNSNDEVHVCQLCGAWYETRKGLASHARAHLRQFGVTENTETRGGPIELLHQIMDAEDLKPIGSGGKPDAPKQRTTPTKASVKRPSGSSPAGRGAAAPKVSPSSPLAPTRKRPKFAGLDGGLAHDYMFSSGAAAPAKVFTCILCGEEFENRKGLASHSRSHLRQLGVTDLLGKASAIDTVQQLVSSGVLAAVNPVSAKASSPAPAPAPSPVGSPEGPPRTEVRGPRAKKGSRLAVPKPEPVEVQVSDVGTLDELEGCKSVSPSQRWSSPSGSTQSLNTSASDLSAIPIIPCEFCGQFFDSRKALSCHARSHLRQLGITWSLNESPIDTLQEVMLKGDVKREPVHGGPGPAWIQASWAPQVPKRSLDGLSSERPSPKTITPPLDFSLKEKPSPDKGSASHAAADACCELCGFDFENRKALASHARAHLRQLGVVEKGEGVKGSPIEILTQWIQREPAKVAEITRRYRVGDLYIKKRLAHLPPPSMKSEPVPSGSQKAVGLQLGRRAGREVAGVAVGSSKASQERSHNTHMGHQHTLTHNQMQTGRGDLNVRSPRGFDRRPLKTPVHTDDGEGDSNSQQPSRSGNIPALLPRPPLTPLVKLVGKVYSLKCRFCEEVFHGPRSVQEDWIRHLQKHILDLSYNKPSPPPTPSQDPQPVVLVPVSSPIPSTLSPVLLGPLTV
ncbi:protein Wiz-like [Hypomesus transpacificus]|uniref:protein Wiz-like n=1 Tax=Hypomesus transpacificus TaxID=137520 RepID=UPI001F07FF1A|nr:protein Wiz-like [Hypomesus transpacificus]